MNTETFAIVKQWKRNALTIEQCKELPTKRLLTYYKKYRRGRHYGICGCCGEFAYDRDGSDERINNAVNQYLDIIQRLLSKREHVA